MSQSNNKDDNWLVRPSTIRLLWIVSMAVLAVTVLADLLIDRKGKFGIDGTIGFYAWYGFLSCVVLVASAKGLGVLLRRKDTYYDD